MLDLLESPSDNIAFSIRDLAWCSSIRPPDTSSSVGGNVVVCGLTCPNSEELGSTDLPVTANRIFFTSDSVNTDIDLVMSKDFLSSVLDIDLAWR